MPIVFAGFMCKRFVRKIEERKPPGHPGGLFRA